MAAHNVCELPERAAGELKDVSIEILCAEARAQEANFVRGVDRAFQRFWRATRARGIHQFQDLAAILKYLKMCLASVLLDEARARRRQASVSIDDLAPDACVSTDPSTEVVANIAQLELWKAIDRELRTDAERLVVRLSFAAGLSPREIRALHPEHFPDIAEVYRLKRNLIERLRRSKAISDLV